MYTTLDKLSERPKVFSAYTAASLWSDAYRAKKMLEFHLNEHIDVSSRQLQFIENSVQWITKTFSISQGSRICDLGCGPGLYTRRLAETGATVTGIDFSKNSIDYAKKDALEKGLEIAYIHANYLNLELSNHYDLITMIMCDFCALSPVQRKELLLKIKSLLSPGGHVLMDFYSLNHFKHKEETVVFEKNQLNQFWYKDDYYCFVHSYKYEPEKVILDKYSLFPKSGPPETVYNWLQCYDLDLLKTELTDTGLSIKAVYSDVCGRAYDPKHSEFAVVLKNMY